MDEILEFGVSIVVVIAVADRGDFYSANCSVSVQVNNASLPKI